MAAPVTDQPKEHAGVIAPPPLIYLVPLLLGILLQHWFPRSLVPVSLATPLGSLLILLGMVGLPAIIAFRRAGTRPEPWKPVTALVTTGPYRFSRNPMYVGLTVIYLGVTVLVNSFWPLLFLPVILPLMLFGVVRREEAYMERRFGDEYRAYRTRVRRWL